MEWVFAVGIWFLIIGKNFVHHVLPRGIAAHMMVIAVNIKVDSLISNIVATVIVIRWGLGLGKSLQRLVDPTQ